MRINCLACGHKVELGDAYDDFEGQVRCLCRAMLEIKTEEGKLKSIRLAETVARPAGKTPRVEGAPPI
jgi:hypothetical protein